jgi:glycosyltransferase involved in cell wall biosynthesis
MGRTLVALAEVAWGYFRTRKQFLLTRLAARGWRVIYLEPLASGRGNAWRARVEEGVTVITVPFLKVGTRQPLYNAATMLAPVRSVLERVAVAGVRRALAGVTDVRPDVVLLSNVYAAKALSAVRARLVCYDFNDHPLQFARVPAWTGGFLRSALSRADLVLAVSPHYARWLRTQVTVPVVTFGNGVEFDRFARPSGPVPETLARVPQPRVGYAGKVSHFLDFDLLEQLARGQGFELVLVGPLPDETRHAVVRLRRSPSAHVLGEVPYAELPAVLQGFDVALIPFRAGDPYTVGINPNKIYQYWAAGLPVVSSPIADFRADGTGLSFADTPGGFDREVRRLLAAPPDREALRERARAHDWDTIARRLDGLLRTALVDCAERGHVNRDSVREFEDAAE